MTSRRRASTNGDAEASSLARWVSIIGHPFVMVAIMVSAAGLHDGTLADTVRGVALVALLTVAPVAWLMYSQVRRGNWQNVDASRRGERPALYLIALLALLVLLTYLRFSGSPSYLVHGTLSTLAMLVLASLANRWVKVSLHMAFAALASVTLSLAGSPLGWLLVGSLPLLWWSRLTLDRHRPLELALGCVLGLLGGLAIHFG